MAFTEEASRQSRFLMEKTVSHWSADGKTVYYADGTSEVFNRNNVTGYTVTGLKYVPVEIKRADLAAFAESHAIVKKLADS